MTARRILVVSSTFPQFGGDHRGEFILRHWELQAAPGTVCCFLNEAMDLQLGRARRTAHEVALRDLLDIARLRDVLPADRALVGIQPETIAWRASLSETAVAALPVVRGTICELLLYWDQAG